MRALGTDVLVTSMSNSDIVRANPNAYARVATTAALPADAVIAHAAALSQYMSQGDDAQAVRQAGLMLDRYGRGETAEANPALAEKYTVIAPARHTTTSAKR